jgi:hypothetical protein
MTGLSLDPAGDHFTLRSTKEDGTVATMPLSPLEVLTIADMVPTLRQMAVMMLHPQSNKGGLTPIAAMDVADFRSEPEALGERLLLLMQLGTGGTSTSAVASPKNLAERLAQELPPRLAAMQERSTRQ